MTRAFPLLLLALLAGCHPAVNPSFDLTKAAADADLDRMTRQPKSLQRPLVVLGGFVDLLGIHRSLESAMREHVVGGPIVSVGFIDCGDFESCRLKLLKQLENTLPSPDPDQTVEVDVVGYSMGGLVARFAASPPPGSPGPRLRINRLFTISTPHRGAQFAATIAPGPLAQDMKPDSPFLHELAQRESDHPPYELFPYVILGDGIVGDDRAAPEGDVAWWTSGGPNEHIAAAYDHRIRADILRRLRAEKPFTTTPRDPLPAPD